MSLSAHTIHVHKSLLLGQGDQPYLDDEASDDNVMSTTDSRLPDGEQYSPVQTVAKGSSGGKSGSSTKQEARRVLKQRSMLCNCV